MDGMYDRTMRVIGEAAAVKLIKSRVAVFGLGGVGGYAAEALARGGVGQIDLIDSDTVCETDLNRQIIALRSTLGKRKTEAFAERIADINPLCKVTRRDVFYLPECADSVDFSLFDYVIDAIDTVAGKLAVIERAYAAGVPAVSVMGAGNKLDPTAFEVADIYSTSVCPLARVMRRELRKRGIPSLKTVYSREEPRPCGSVTGSVSFVPGVAGLIAASVAIKELCGCPP